MLRLLSMLLALALIAGLLLAVVVLDRTPLVPHAQPTSPAEQQRVAALLESAAQGSGVRTLRLTARDLALLIDLALPRLLEGVRPGPWARDARARLTPTLGQADAALSLPLGAGGWWLNVSATLVQGADLPEVRHLRLGGLRLPDGLADLLLEPVRASIAGLGPPVQVAFARGQLHLRIDADALADGDTELGRLRAAQGRLARQLAQSGRSPDLAPLLARLLADADLDDPVATHRATLLALAVYALTGRLPPGSGRDLPDGRRLQLHGRADLAKHYLASAALVVGGDSGLSSVVGLAKEFDDAERGSGFSFADLAANRAGIRLVQVATGNPDSARRLALRARAGLTDADLLPSVAGLPEGIDRRRFDLDYGGGYGEPYSRLVEHIDRRLDGLALYQSPVTSDQWTVTSDQ